MEVGLLSLGACCCCKAGALNLKSCSNIHRFGYGWRGDERTFSVIKSLFGEYVTAKLVDMAKEMVMKASKELHIRPETVIKHTNGFRKSKGKWIAKSQDRISRVMSVYENGHQKWIEIRDSRTASKIGKYNLAVNEFLRTGNEDVLRPFKNPFKESNGKLHYFETDPDKLYGIAESQEEPEFYEIYKI